MPVRVVIVENLDVRHPSVDSLIDVTNKLCRIWLVSWQDILKEMHSSENVVNRNEVINSYMSSFLF